MKPLVLVIKALHPLQPLLELLSWELLPQTEDYLMISQLFPRRLFKRDYIVLITVILGVL